jgi:transposase
VEAVTPLKVRNAIVRLFARGHRYRDIAAALGVGEATVSRVLRLYRESGALVPRPRGGGNFSPIRDDVAQTLEALVAETPDATADELRRSLETRTGIATSRSSVHRALHRMGFSRKKSASLPRSGTRR